MAAAARRRLRQWLAEPGHVHIAALRRAPYARSADWGLTDVRALTSAEAADLLSAPSSARTASTSAFEGLLSTLSAMAAAVRNRSYVLKRLVLQFFNPGAITMTQAITAAALQIELAPGERYAGVVLDADGRVQHHLVLLASQGENLTHPQAIKWAASVGGQLPTQQEQALLYANCKPHLRPRWHWSSETYEADASCAWGCDFISGYQLYGHESWQACAVAVRRLAA